MTSADMPAATCDATSGKAFVEHAARSVLGMRVDATSYAQAAAQVAAWARAGEAHTVCVANVHMTMQGVDDAAFRGIVNNADLVTPDGMPLVWMLHRLGVGDATRVYGPTLMLHVCEKAEQEEIPIGLYGGTEASLEELRASLLRRYPRLQVAYAHSPPFRPLTTEEDADAVGAIRASGARILFVGLGCPKQERWMAAHAQRLPLVQLGVGAAFEIHAGRLRQAPAWMQGRGLEWLFRLAVEPRRLWRRYLYNNPRFLVLAALQLLGLRRTA